MVLLHFPYIYSDNGVSRIIALNKNSVEESEVEKNSYCRSAKTTGIETRG